MSVDTSITTEELRGEQLASLSELVTQLVTASVTERPSGERMAAALRVVVTAPLVDVRNAVQSMRENGENDLRTVLHYIDMAQTRLRHSLPTLERLCERASQYYDALDAVPPTAGDALLALGIAERAHTEAALAYVEAASRALDLDDVSGVERRRCAALIQKEHIEHGAVGTKPLSDTALDKLAGDHPEYRAHREKVVAAKKDEIEARAHMEIVAKRFEVAKVLARSFFVARIADEV